MDRYPGLWRGIVRDNRDPLKLGRVRCQVPEVLGHDVWTNWASPVLPMGTADGKGACVVPPIGAGVWVGFEAGCPDRPLWMGGWAAQPNGTSEVPSLARGVADESQQSPKGTDSVTMRDGTTVNEPPIAFAAQYPNNLVLKTSAGIVIELDSTPGAERVHIWHPKKTWIEMMPDGSLVERVDLDRYICIEGKDTLHIAGDWNVRVEGTARITTTGPCKIDSTARVEVNAPEVRLADGGPPIARVGDDVLVTFGDSAGRHPIVSGSSKVNAG